MQILSVPGGLVCRATSWVQPHVCFSTFQNVHLSFMVPRAAELVWSRRYVSFLLTPVTLAQGVLR